MKISSLIFTSGALLASGVAAFSPAARSSTSSTQLYQFATMQQGGLVNVADEYAQRDVYSMEEWATQYGTQKADGVELYSADGSDYQLITQSPISAGETVLFVPADIILNSAAIQQEFGTSLQQAEQAVVQIDQGAAYRLPLFRLMMKILVEYEKGQDSMFYPWLNSLPRQYFNGVSMTKACFNCLPPYAGWLTSTERINYSHFAAASKLSFIEKIFLRINNHQLSISHLFHSYI